MGSRWERWRATFVAELLTQGAGLLQGQGSDSREKLCEGSSRKQGPQTPHSRAARYKVTAPAARGKTGTKAPA
eukprot:3841626-Pleurochrysis_carterae.AAC.1